MDLIKEEMSATCCLNCLSKSSERNIVCYKLQSVNLKNIFKVDVLSLCFICKKIVQNAECVIEQIVNNQILLNLNFSEQNINVMAQPCFNIAVLNPIELSGVDEQTDEPFVYEQGVYKNVKEEMKCEGDDYLQNPSDFIDIQIDVKNEPLDINEYKTDVNEIEILNTVEKKGTMKGRKRTATTVTGNFEVEIKCQDNTESTNDTDSNETETKETVTTTGKRSRVDKSTCQKIFINLEQLMQERILKANEKTYVNCPYKCMDCVKGFAYKGTYLKHMELHSKEKGDFECIICKQRMDSNIKLLRHNKTHHVRYKCLICGIIQKTNTKDHYNSYHSKNAILYKCKICPRTFTDRHNLRKHNSYCHRNRSVICAHCMKTYANKDVLRNHIQLRHPAVLPPKEIKKSIICMECGKCFVTPSQLKAHSLKHSTERRFYCVECDKSYKCEYTLKQHLKLASPHVKPNELQFPCTLCERRFGIKRDLERHVNRIHLNIRPYKCDLCEKAFNNSWSVKKHKKIAHEGYKRPYIFPCSLCDKIFDQKSILKSHIRTHTGERPYQCTICPAKFTQSSSLSTHTKLVHLKQTRDGKPKNLK